MSDFSAEGVWMLVAEHILENDPNCVRFFNKLDQTGLGFVSWIDLKNKLPELIDRKLTDEQAQLLVDECDINDDGKLSARELKEYIKPLMDQARARRRRQSQLPIVKAKGLPPTPPEKTLRPKQGSRPCSPRRAPNYGKAQAAITVDNLLANIVGQAQIKEQVRAFEKALQLDKKRREMGKSIDMFRPPHMAFLGNPGTGKTSIARAMSQVLKNLKYLSKGEIKEVQRSDLVACHIGQTGPQTKKIVEEAKGGVLFIDEAYRLIPSSQSDKDFGKEALDELMQHMGDGDPVMIFAGYEKEMKVFLDSNPGLLRRITKQYIFADYSASELAEIFSVKLRLRGFTYEGKEGGEAKAAFQKSIEQISPRQRSWMNGGLIDHLMEFAKEEEHKENDKDREGKKDVKDKTDKEHKEQKKHKDKKEKKDKQKNKVNK
eukprot:TRINITY_DN8820_c0_g1_i11.p1 TRINITY_DN8820_c0_g1~~TRINITY_DN8820_c0_g1_i11.p1  ORF type:complete len:457 (-),score=109.27 TRINITY_DN8820_c0_g1_i11:35-1327(-)